MNAVSKIKPNNVPKVESERELAQADGLTKFEAMELAQWLQQSGHASIQLTCERDRCRVRWRN
jgi:hypothetical protein